MRNSAEYVARVGGLAVALGIGTAVATGQGLALADSPDGASGTTSNGPSQSKSESPDAGPKAAPGGPTAPDKGVVHSTGGAQTGSDPSTSVENDPDDPSASTPVSGSEADTTGPVYTEPGKPVEPTGTPPTVQPDDDGTGASDPALQSARHSTSTPHVSSRPDSKPAGDVKAQPRTSGITGMANSVGQPAVDTTISTVDAKLQEDKPELARTTGNSALTMATLSTPASRPVIAQAAVTPQATTAPVPSIVTGLLSAFGLGALASSNPLAPAAPPPTLLGVLEWVRREINRMFFNESPVGITYNPDANSLVNGHIVGTLTPDDPDSTAFTFTATRPAHGEVEVSPNGTFVYTPDATYTGEDFFDVTVSDASSGFHIHGLSGLLNLVTFGLLGESGHTHTQTISVSGDVPPGEFTVSTVVSGLNQPTDFRFLPDGRILFAEKGGAIKVANKDGQLQSTPLITLPTTTNWARGLAAIEVDPHYQDNGNIYVSYVRSDNYQRLSRLTVTDPKAAVLTVDPDSELVLVQGTQPAGDDHQGGGLSFGADGKLYWAVGDNTCCTVIDDKNAQSLSNMYGKVLRLNPDGTAPADNPFYDGAGPNYDAIYATGFRNPFRLTFTPDGQLLVVDVGQATWEEVNLVTRGANYGWPNAEGPCNGIGTTSCSTPSSYANPIYAYRHTTGGNSITSVMVYTGSTSGSGVNTVLIADFNQGWIKELTFNSDYASLIRERMFDDAAAGSTNQLAQDPEGNIYQLTFDGKLSRISPSSDVLSTV